MGCHEFVCHFKISCEVFIRVESIYCTISLSQGHPFSGPARLLHYGKESVTLKMLFNSILLFSYWFRQRLAALDREKKTGCLLNTPVDMQSLELKYRIADTKRRRADNTRATRSLLELSETGNDSLLWITHWNLHNADHVDVWHWEIGVWTAEPMG